MRRVVLIFSFAVACVSLSGCWQGMTREVLATVLSVRGEAAWAMEGRNDVRPITSQTKFGTGSIVRTFQDAQIDMTLVPGALARISSNSELKIEKLRLSKDGNETEDGMRSRVVGCRVNFPPPGGHSLNAALGAGWRCVLHAYSSGCRRHRRRPR